MEISIWGAFRFEALAVSIMRNVLYLSPIACFFTLQ